VSNTNLRHLSSHPASIFAFVQILRVKTPSNGKVFSMLVRASSEMKTDEATSSKGSHQKISCSFWDG
ncbi:hypothetical protein ACQP3C_28990, partial [Escherichia coli]